MTRDVILRVRVTREERAAWQGEAAKTAKDVGMRVTVSDLIRGAVNGRIVARKAKR